MWKCLTFGIMGLIACGESEKETELTEGMSAGDCTDGADNDGDGLFDCDDDGCSGSPDCQNTTDTGISDTGTSDTGDTNVSDPLDIDDDGDGFTENEGDCDDSDPTIFTGAEDSTVDGIDQDCNDFDGPDADGDGFADAAAGGTDCDDSDANVNPDAEEDFTDGIDQDCDGYADVSNAQCSADLTITFPNEETVTLDFCQNWSMETTYEYDPDNPPELNSMFVELNATTDSDFNCRLRFRRTGICSDGYYRLGTKEEGNPNFFNGAFIYWSESTLGNQEELILETMDCLGVSDENEMTVGFEQGWLRIDSINTGTEAGSFANTPLLTEIQGKLNVWSASGLSLVGNIQLTSTQIASDQEENICDKVSDERVNADWDSDGFINSYFEGDDCYDRNSADYYGWITGDTVFPGSAENDSLTECMKDDDGDGYGDADFSVYWHQDGYWAIGSGAYELGVAGTDCNDADVDLNSADNDGDGYSTCTGDCDDTNVSLTPEDADGDGYSTCTDDCDDTDAALISSLFDTDCDGNVDVCSYTASDFVSCYELMTYSDSPTVSIPYMTDISTFDITVSSVAGIQRRIYFSGNGANIYAANTTVDVLATQDPSLVIGNDVRYLMFTPDCGSNLMQIGAQMTVNMISSHPSCP